MDTKLSLYPSLSYYSMKEKCVKKKNQEVPNQGVPLVSHQVQSKSQGTSCEVPLISSMEKKRGHNNTQKPIWPVGSDTLSSASGVTSMPIWSNTESNNHTD